MQEDKLVLGNFTIQAQAPMGKTFTVSGYIYAGDDKNEVNAQIDLLHDVIDRQRLKAELPELEARLEQRMQAMNDIKDHFLKLEEQKNKGIKMSTAVRTNYENAQATMKKLADEVEKGILAIADAKEKIK
jgi:hypothetical protein